MKSIQKKDPFKNKLIGNRKCYRVFNERDFSICAEEIVVTKRMRGGGENLSR